MILRIAGLRVLSSIQEIILSSFTLNYNIRPSNEDEIIIITIHIQQFREVV